MINYTSILQDRVNALKAAGLYRSFLPVQKQAATAPRFSYTDANGQDRTAINWCSNDYLNMGVHPDVIAALQDTAAEAGAGSGGTRNISGTTTWHRQLEARLALLHQTEKALLFNSAYMANLTTLTTLARLLPGLIYISDERNHASVIEGIRGGGGEKHIFRHNDMAHLETILQGLPVARPKIIVFESVYSMCGTVAAVNAILTLAYKYNALSYIDEVHAVGLYGRNGAGITATTSCSLQPDIINGTLAKGFGVMGGYIAANAVITDAIRSFASGFIFTTSLSPALCAAAETSIRLVMEDNTIRAGFHEKVATLRHWLKAYDVPFCPNGSHITPIHIGDAVTCKAIAYQLLNDYGLYLQPVQYPTVPKGEACLRIVVTLRHDTADMIYLAESLKAVLADRQSASIFHPKPIMQHG
jgi:5-aminolevulinate synthase